MIRAIFRIVLLVMVGVQVWAVNWTASQGSLTHAVGPAVVDAGAGDAAPGAAESGNGNATPASPAEGSPDSPDPSSPQAPGTLQQTGSGAVVQPGSTARTPPSRPSGGHIAIIPIEGMIYDFTVESFKRRVDRALAGSPQPSIIVVELNTPGGVVTSAIELARYIRDIPVETIAWVNSEAYSAGTLVATACNSIMMSPSSAMGDSAPVAGSLFGMQNLAPTERAKLLSPVLTEYYENATRNGYPYAMLHAMCVVGVEVYEVQHQQTGEVRYVQQADYFVMVEGLSIDEANAKVREAFANKFSGYVVSGQPMGTPPGTAGAGSFVPGEPRVALATDADRSQWTRVRELHPGPSGSGLFTLTQTLALEVGLAEAADIRTEDQARAHLNAATSIRVNPTWSEVLAEWAMSLPVRVVLVVLLVLGIFVEMISPGLGAGAAVAALALAALVLAPYLVGLAHVWHLAVLLLGIMLILVEFFILPGFGVAGVSGLVCIFVGLVLMAVPSAGGGWMPLPAREASDMLQAQVVTVLIGLSIAGIAAFFISRHFRTQPLFARLILQDSQPTVIGHAEARIDGDACLGEGHIKLGDEGVVITQLRPTGRAQFGEHVIDVIADGTWVEAQANVRVIEVHGNRIVVERVE